MHHYDRMRRTRRFRRYGTLVVALAGLFSSSTAQAQSFTFTVQSDFEGAYPINVDGRNDELSIKTLPNPLPYIWVGCSRRGTIVRIATSNFDPLTGQTVQRGQILGEYWSSPSACRPTSSVDQGPSRTTVDFDGNVWAGNRHNITVSGQTRGHVVKIGSGFAFQWRDRDAGGGPNGVLDTSSGLGDLKPWPDNADGQCTSADLPLAEDELILLYRDVPAQGVRLVAVDRENDVWVGGTGGARLHGRLDGQTGQEDSLNAFGNWAFAVTCPQTTTIGGYGGLVDRDGFLWAADDGSHDFLLRFRPHPQSGLFGADVTCLSVPRSYGVGVDTEGDIWVSRWEVSRVREIDPAPPFAFSDFVVGFQARGVTVSPLAPAQNHVWVANSFPSTVTRLDRDGSAPDLTGTIPLTFAGQSGVTPTGVALDAGGFVWVTNLDSNDVMIIDPQAGGIGAVVGRIDLDTVNGALHPAGHCSPYNYSDMTGMNLMWTIAPAGTWSAVVDGGSSGTFWGTVSWEADLTGNPGNKIRVSVRATDVVTDLGKEIYRDVENGIRFTCSYCPDETSGDCTVFRGRFLQVRVQLNAMLHDPQTWPTVQSITVQADSTAQDCDADGISDDCEVVFDPSTDCNGNGVPDECDIQNGMADCNFNGVPDECEPDCNGNGYPDACDITNGTSCDLDDNSIPDECAACCIESTCVPRSPAVCYAQGGAPYPGLSCTQCSCAAAACCRDIEPSCEVMVGCECEAAGWYPLQPPHKATVIPLCLETTCTTGACCNENGDCYAFPPACFPEDRYVGGAACTDAFPCGFDNACNTECCNETECPVGQHCCCGVCRACCEEPTEPLPPGQIIWNTDPLSPERATRSLRFTVQPPEGGTAMEAAIKVTMIGLQHPDPPNLPQFPPKNLACWEAGIACGTVVPGSPGTCSGTGEANGCARWVGKPGTFYEAQGPPLSGPYRATRLQCTPVYWDWITETSYDPITVVGAEILPSSTYDVQLYGLSCAGNESCCGAVSSVVTMVTRRSGDVDVPYYPGSVPITTQPNALDITQVVNHFKRLVEAPVKARAQVQPNLPELNADVSALDIVAVVDAVKEFAYSHSGPCPCPSTQPCGQPCAGCTGLCVKTCVGGPNAGQPCINDSHCPDVDYFCSGTCVGGPNDGQRCINDDNCPGTYICLGVNVGERCYNDDDYCLVYGTCDCDFDDMGVYVCFCDGDTSHQCLNGWLDCIYRGTCSGVDAHCGTTGTCRDRCGRCSD